MVVQHNLTAMNSNRMLGITTKSQSKSTEKLSSGYKINRAADDAAGLAISEKMRKQIRGLTQASANAQDGISAVQIAEGALTEVHDMIQRMNELAVKSANGTNSQEERDYIQLEIDELVKEIDRVAETTKFNDIYLLKGSDEGDEGETRYSYSYLVTEDGIGVADGKTLYNEDGSVVTAGDLAGYKDIDKAVADGKFFTDVTVDNADKIASDAALAVDAALQAFITSNGGTIEYVEGKVLYDANGQAIDPTDLGAYFKDDSGTIKWQATVASDVYTARKGDTANKAADTDFKEVAAQKLYDADGKEISASALADLFDDEGNLKADVTVYDSATAVTDGVAALDQDGVLAIVNQESETISALKLSLHVGAESADANKIILEIQSMDATSIKVTGLDVSSEDSATAAIDQLNKALKIVSEQRAKLGAVQNRLEHTINNLDNIVENTTSAESQIRDTDMATEMVRYSNNNILAQAGQAMLAQSNQANQGVLSLLG